MKVAWIGMAGDDRRLVAFDGIGRGSVRQAGNIEQDIIAGHDLKQVVAEPGKFAIIAGDVSVWLPGRGHYAQALFQPPFALLGLGDGFRAFHQRDYAMEALPQRLVLAPGIQHLGQVSGGENKLNALVIVGQPMVVFQLPARQRLGIAGSAIGYSAARVAASEKIQI